MRLYDSKTKAKIELNADKNGVVNIYLCGPTVYDEAHLGHARSAVCFDLLVRTLLALGFCVNFARNYTDIDDKILNKMKEQNLTLKALTEHYIKAYEKDMKALNVLEPKFKPRATEYISQMIELIEKLEKRGFTYTLKDGVYFDSSKDKAYLSLSHRTLGENQSRLEKGVNKKNESDFVLWKFDENFYYTPFGRGRPGWHTECVAMINALFDTLHIHCGGADLLFPHHENEVAQHRCACGGDLARIWLHNGFVKIKGEKMSKSLNNSFFIKDALKDFNGEVLRFYLLQTHYRSDFNYDLSDLEMAKKRLDKFYRLKNRLQYKRTKDLEFDKKTRNYKTKKDTPNENINEILEILSDDLNISSALEQFDKFIMRANSQLDEFLRFKTWDKFDEFEYKRYKKNRKEIWLEFKKFALIFGVGFLDPTKYFQSGVSAKLKAEIKKKISERNEAKRCGDYARADTIRAELAYKNIVLQDKPNGETTWEIKK